MVNSKLHYVPPLLLLVFRPGYTLTTDTTPIDQDQNILGLSPSDVEMEFAEYCLLYDPRLPTTGWRLEAQTKLIVNM